MDVYFEKIAGVGERRPERRVPQVAGLEVEVVPPEEGAASEAVQLDENGFPLSPLADQDELWFVQASQLYQPLKSCARIARTNGSMLILGGLATGVLGLAVFHVVTIVIGLILATLGSIERSGANDVASGKPTAPARLAWNQLMLFGLVALYCGAQMKSFHTAHASTGFGATQLAASLPTQELGKFSEDVTQAIERLGPAIEANAPRVVYGFYGLVIIGSFVFQGALAMYYLTRKRKLRLFHQELPPWVAKIALTFVAH